MAIRGEIYSARVDTERRTYFFNVKENRRGEYFLNLVESDKQGEERFERRSIIVYKEDIDRFRRAMLAAIEAVESSNSLDAGLPTDREDR